MNDEDLDRMLEALPRQAAVSSDQADAIWNAVQPRLDQDRIHRGTRWSFGIAAAAAILLVTGLTIGRPAPATLQSTLAWNFQGAPAYTPGSNGAAPLLPAERDLEVAVHDLERAYRAQREMLDPSLLAVFDENLALVGDAVTQSRAALAASPGDPHLQLMLHDAYDQKLSLLAHATSSVSIETPRGLP